ncbi:MAG: hypothetical protein LBK23_07040 [Oscillospiraceae bacterium]|jgi:hypothetical protein|nr:hypothetical protein [Oscillospiraceae bacterium]
MYLKKMTNKKTGRTYLSIAHGYRDKEKGYSTNVTIRKLGYLDELEKEYPDPIAHFTQVAREMTEQANREKHVDSVVLDLNERLPQNSDGRRNLGYAAIVKVFHELGLDRFLCNRQRVEDYRQQNPEATKAECNRATGLDPKTIRKWWNIKENS